MSEQFDQSFFVLSVIGIWILEFDALSTEKGREQVRDAFRSAMLGAGSFEDLLEIPEFKQAMQVTHQVESGEPEGGVVSVDPSELSPITEAN